MNPYERRRPPRRADDAMVMRGVGPVWAGFEQRGPRESPVTFHDLEVLVHHAHARGEREADARAIERTREGQRAAWDEGREAGVTEGRRELLEQVDARIGGEVRAALQATINLLDPLDRDPRRVSKGELVEQLRQHATLLQRLVDEHHQGFAEDIPF